MKHKVLIKFLSVILILLGIILLFFPKSYEWYRGYRQQKLIESWEESFQLLGNENEKEEECSEGDEEYRTYGYEYQDTNTIDHENKNDLNDKNDKNDMNEESSTVNPEKELEEKIMNSSNRIEGIIKIDKIDLEVPILTGATAKNMAISVTSIDNTGIPGKYGNYCIAGHRSRTYGRNFNRLDEVDVGDEIVIKTRAERYQYTVTEKLYVNPDDVWVLESNQKIKEITLVTCHPFGESTQRLIIKGILDET